MEKLDEVHRIETGQAGRAGVAGYPDERCGPPVGTSTRQNLTLFEHYFRKDLIVELPLLAWYFISPIKKPTITRCSNRRSAGCLPL